MHPTHDTRPTKPSAGHRGSPLPPRRPSPHHRPHRGPRRPYARHRGVVAVLAMMFLIIFSSLAAAMAIVAQGNLATAESYQRVNRSLAAAETGMTYFTWQLAAIAETITTPQGEVDEALADDIWQVLRDAILDDIGGDLHYLDSHSVDSNRIRMGRVPVGAEDNAPTYRITVRRHPMNSDDYNNPRYQRYPYNVGDGNNRFTADGEPVSPSNPVSNVWLRITSLGEDGDYRRAIEIDFRIDKKIRYAILSRNRIMIGRNVMIQGSIGSRYTHTNYAHGHPVQMLDDFRGRDEQLDEWLDAFTDYLAEHDVDGDNRIHLEDERESAALANAKDLDLNGDGYVDAYDFFLMRFGDGSGGVPIDNFTDTSGNLIDADLWQMINEFKYPPGTEFDWSNYRVKTPDDPVWRNAQADLRYINNDDLYAKVHGEIILASSRDAWQDGAAGGRYQDFFKGPVHPDEDDIPLTFEADDTALIGPEVGDFDVSGYRQMATADFHQQASDGGTFTPAGSAPIEEVPYQAAHPYDFYHRPVYEGYTFENVVIPAGLNALFIDCTFRGVTFVETNPDNTDPRYDLAGTQAPDGSLLYEHLEVDVGGGETDNDTKAYSNNIRFHDTTFEGMVVTEPPKEFTHMRNKLQFTGKINFDLDAPFVGDNRELFERSTLLAPHYSIDMGTFVNPQDSSNVVRLEGTIVAGVFDIRGQATIDGSIITTFEPEPGEGPLTYGGSPAAFNTTIGYFSAEDGDAEAEMPDEGLGKIIIRYDPERALPDGINGPIEIRPDMATYMETAG